MTRPAARISHTEVVRLVKAVRTAGLDVHRVTFDGGRIDIVTTPEVRHSPPREKPDTFQSWEEYEAWRDNRNADGCA